MPSMPSTGRQSPAGMRRYTDSRRHVVVCGNVDHADFVAFLQEFYHSNHGMHECRVAILQVRQLFWLSELFQIDSQSSSLIKITN